MLEEEPPGELNPNKPRNEHGNEATPKKKKWWKKVAPKKRRSPPSPRTASSNTPNMNFGEHDFVSFLSMQVIGSFPSATVGKRHHLFEPP